MFLFATTPGVSPQLIKHGNEYVQLLTQASEVQIHDGSIALGLSPSNSFQHGKKSHRTINLPEPFQDGHQLKIQEHQFKSRLLDLKKFSPIQAHYNFQATEQAQAQSHRMLQFDILPNQLDSYRSNTDSQESLVNKKDLSLKQKLITRKHGQSLKMSVQNLNDSVNDISFKKINPNIVRYQAYQQPSPEMALRLLNQSPTQKEPLNLGMSVEYALRSGCLQPTKVVKRSLNPLTRSFDQTHINIQEYINAKLEQNFKAKRLFNIDVPSVQQELRGSYNSSDAIQTAFQALSMNSTDMINPLDGIKGNRYEGPFKSPKLKSSLKQSTVLKMKKIDNQINKINQIILRDPGNPLKPIRPFKQDSLRESESSRAKKLQHEVITQSGKLTLIDIKLENNVENSNVMRKSYLSKGGETQTLIGGSFLSEKSGLHFFKTKHGKFSPLKTQNTVMMRDSDLIANQSIAEADEESLNNNIQVQGSQLKQPDAKAFVSVQGKLNSSADIERERQNIRNATLTHRNQWADKQILLYDSQHEFTKAFKNQKHNPNSTVRNIAGFGQLKNNVQNKTLFSNSLIRDSVMSTLKHMTDKEDRSEEQSITSIAGETLNELELTKPKIDIQKPKMTQAMRTLAVTQNEAFNLMLIHQSSFDPVNPMRRASVVNQSSCLNEQNIEPSEFTQGVKTLKRVIEPSKIDRPVSRNSYDSELSVSGFDKKIPAVEAELVGVKQKKPLLTYNSIPSMHIEFPQLHKANRLPQYTARKKMETETKIKKPHLLTIMTLEYDQFQPKQKQEQPKLKNQPTGLKFMEPVRHRKVISTLVEPTKPVIRRAMPYENLKKNLDTLERSKIRLPGIHRYFDKYSQSPKKSRRYDDQTKE